MSDLELAIRLLPFLSAHGGITVDEVAAEFSITNKKVMQILKLLPYTGRGQFGGELVDISVTEDGAIYVHDAQSLDLPVRLSGSQAFTMLASLSYLQNLPVFSEQDEVAQLIEKISAALGVDVPAVSVAASPRQLKTIELLKRAVREHESVVIDYASASAVNSPRRTIDPLAMFVSEDRTYVNAWCHEAQSIRSFRIDRIATVELTGSTFEPIDGEQAELTGERVVLNVTNDALSEFDALQLESHEELADGRHKIALQVANTEWLIRMAIAQGGDVEIVEPMAVREQLVARTRQWLATK